MHLHSHPEYSLQLEAAPMRAAELFKNATTFGCAWQPQNPQSPEPENPNLKPPTPQKQPL